MSEPFLGEVQIFGFNFAPRNWALAAGQTVPIRQYGALFALYGTSFGGDGVNTFSLPNLASRQACGAGQSPGNSRRRIGDTFGTMTVGLTALETPMHNHMISEYEPNDFSSMTAAPSAASTIGVVGDSGFNVYAAVGSGSTAMNGAAIGVSGNGAPHINTQPYLGMIYAVALNGVFPSFD